MRADVAVNTVGKLGVHGFTMWRRAMTISTGGNILVLAHMAVCAGELRVFFIRPLEIGSYSAMT